MRSIAGTTRRISSSGVISSKPPRVRSEAGRVDWPPTSRMSAPSSTNRRASATASSALSTPSPENDSGETLITPMMYVRAPHANVFGPMRIDAAVCVVTE